MAELPITEAFNLALEYHQSGRLAEADSWYRSMVTRQARQAVSMLYRGLIALQVGQKEIAVELIQRSIILNPIMWNPLAT